MDESVINTIITEYQKGESLNTLAKKYHTYPTSITRILEKHKIELRHDALPKDSHYKIIQDGKKLLTWVKNQNRLVTKKELAEVIGIKRLPNSYFQIYPELGQYVASYHRSDISEYTQKLFDWLKKNNISYKPNDRTILSGTPVHALLLEKYNNTVIILDIRSYNVSKSIHHQIIEKKLEKIKEKKLKAIVLQEKHFENLDCIKEILERS